MCSQRKTRIQPLKPLAAALPPAMPEPARKANTIGWKQFHEMFSDEESAIRFFEETIWPNGEPVCPHCSSNNAKEVKGRPFYMCRDCRRMFNVFHDTPLYRSNISKRDWLFAICQMMQARASVSALEMQQQLQVNYKTAWHMGHRIREGCSPSAGDIDMGDVVEVDETMVGGKELNKRKSKRLGKAWTRGKTYVVAMTNRQGQTILEVVPNNKEATLRRVIERYAPNAKVLITDESHAYKAIARKMGIKHVFVRHGNKEWKSGIAHTNTCENQFRTLKMQYHGVHVHWSHRHSQRYTDEVAFRHGAGSVENDTIERMRALVRGLVGKHLPRSKLIGRKHTTYRTSKPR